MGPASVFASSPYHWFTGSTISMITRHINGGCRHCLQYHRCEMGKSAGRVVFGAANFAMSKPDLIVIANSNQTPRSRDKSHRWR
jgi:hypothetical protein